MTWLWRRLSHAALLLLAVSLASFLMGRVAPGSFFDDLALNPQIRPETVAKLRARYGIGESLPRRYAAWVASAARGDFGNSIAYQRPVSAILPARVRDTLQTTFTAFAFSWLLAIPWAMLAAARPRGSLDRTGTAIAALFLAIPELLLALGTIFAAVRAGMPALLNSSLLPVAVLTAGAFPIIFSHARTALIEANGATCIRSARAHGIHGPRLWFVFILPLAANPLLSLVGWSIGGLVGASLLVETIFSRPGIGPLFLEAISTRDLDVVTAVLMLSAIFLVLGNLIADVLLGLCDPRIRMDRE